MFQSCDNYSERVCGLKDPWSHSGKGVLPFLIFRTAILCPKKRWNAPCPHVNKQLEERALHGRRGSLWDEIAVVTAWLGLVKHCKSWASSSDSQQRCMGIASDAGSPIRDRVRRGIYLSSDIYGQLPVRRWNQQLSKCSCNRRFGLTLRIDSARNLDISNHKLPHLMLICDLPAQLFVAFELLCVPSSGIGACESCKAVECQVLPSTMV